IGSRYFVLATGFGLLARLRAAGGGGPLGSALGAAQSRWLEGAGERHDGAQWRLVASSVSFTPLRLDLRRPEIEAPAAWAHEVLLNVDHWDGFPVEREAWLDRFDARGTVLLSGDIHASFASQHRERVVEFTTPSVSSKSLGAILERNASGDAATQAAGARLAAHLDPLLLAGYPGLRYAQTRRNGVLLLEFGADALQARYLEMPPELVAESLYDAPDRWRAAVHERRFRVDRHASALRLTPLDG
ncbi:MAG: alkaline phosphatase D family protein, partial [Silanimonas sp.]